MKKESDKKLRLGIFVSVGLFLFIAGIYFIGKKQRLFSSTFKISSVFNNVNGLQVGNNVRFSGINVGTVSNIEIISDTSAKVDMIIDEDTRKFIKKDATVTIGSEGLMGNKVMNISPGSESLEAINDGEFFSSNAPPGIEDLMSSLKTTTENAAHITGDLSAMFQSMREGKGTVGKLLMDTVFAQDVEQAVKSIEKGMGGFSATMDAAQHSFLLRGAVKKEKEKEEKDDKKKEDNQKK